MILDPPEVLELPFEPGWNTAIIDEPVVEVNDDACETGWNPDNYDLRHQRRYTGSSAKDLYVVNERRRFAARQLQPPRPLIPRDHVNVGDLWPGDVIFANGQELEVESLHRKWLAEAPARHVWHLTIKGHGTVRVGMLVDFKLVRRGPRPWGGEGAA